MKKIFFLGIIVLSIFYGTFSAPLQSNEKGIPSEQSENFNKPFVIVLGNKDLIKSQAIWKNLLFKAREFAIMGTYKLFKDLRNSSFVLNIIQEFNEKKPLNCDYKVLSESRLTMAEKRVSDPSLKKAGWDFLIEAAGNALIKDCPIMNNLHLKGLFTENGLLLGTTNLDDADLKHDYRSRDFLIFTNDPSLIQETRYFFNTLFSGEMPSLPLYSVNALKKGETRLSWGPLYHKQYLLDLIQGAKFSIDIYQQDLQDPSIREALISRAKTIKIRILMSVYPFGEKNGNKNIPFLKELEKHGCQIYLVGAIAPEGKAPLHIHAKVLIRDVGQPSQAMYLGSANFYPAILEEKEKNLNVGIITTDDIFITPVAHTFKEDWDAHAPYPEAQLKNWIEKLTPAIS
jgi:hypothetical protein